MLNLKSIDTPELTKMFADRAVRAYEAGDNGDLELNESLSEDVDALRNELVRRGPASVDFLRPLLNDESEATQLCAATSLLTLEPELALTTLQRLNHSAHSASVGATAQLILMMRKATHVV